MSDHLSPTASLLVSPTPLEAALEQASRTLPVNYRMNWAPEKASATILDHLAYYIGVFSTPLWALASTTDSKRDLFLKAGQIFAHSGSVLALKLLAQATNFSEIRIIEDTGRLRYDGADFHDRQFTRGRTANTWARFRVIVKGERLSESRAHAFEQCINLLKPARDVFAGIEYTKNLNFYEGIGRHNGTLIRA